MPAPLPRRVASEPSRGYRLVEVTAPLELQQLHEHVRKSCRGECNLTVVKVERVLNEYLTCVRRPTGTRRPYRHSLSLSSRSPLIPHDHHPAPSPSSGRYKLDKTAKALLSPYESRAVPPQGGYFHGTDRAASLSICEYGFDDRKWKGGKFGIGQCAPRPPVPQPPSPHRRPPHRRPPHRRPS